MNGYVAWPERLFVIFRGKFEYVGGFGPEGYDVVELQRFLEGRFGHAAGPSVGEKIADVANPAAK